MARDHADVWQRFKHVTPYVFAGLVGLYLVMAYPLFVANGVRLAAAAALTVRRALSTYGFYTAPTGATMMDHGRYDALCKDFAARRTDARRTRDTAERTAISFRDAFAAYLGIDNDPEDALVHLKGLALEGDEPVVVDDTTHITLPNAEYEWVFVLDVQIQDSKLKCQCRTRMRDNRIEVRVAEPPEWFPVLLGEPTAFNPACDALYNHIRTWLQWRPSSGRPQPQMGFDLAAG